MAALSQRLLVDVHTHVYLPRYVSFLRARSAVPRVFTRTAPDGASEERLLILDPEPSGGRPMGPQYWDRALKLDFMKRHGIDISIVRLLRPACAPSSRLTLVAPRSSANPWLDFLSAPAAHELAHQLNDDLETYCSTSPALAGGPLKQLYGFGLLPLVPEISALPHLKGVIMGSRGLGNGLDDDALEPVWAALEHAGLVVFLHPHYGVDGKEWGGRDNGHVLPLALGFPFETTIRQDGSSQARGNISATLGPSAGIVAMRRQGSRRMLFGTDHPFFPPLGETERWKSVVDNLEAIDGVHGWDEADKDGVRGGNALALFGL
ncbi:predicted protein [Postia placenta Mad-698-R]|nr:predicted protein [Postia placenta Mad-698-R]